MKWISIGCVRSILPFLD